MHLGMLLRFAWAACSLLYLVVVEYRATLLPSLDFFSLVADRN